MKPFIQQDDGLFVSALGTYCTGKFTNGIDCSKMEFANFFEGEIKNIPGFDLCLHYSTLIDQIAGENITNFDLPSNLFIPIGKSDPHDMIDG